MRSKTVWMPQVFYDDSGRLGLLKSKQRGMLTSLRNAQMKTSMRGERMKKMGTLIEKELLKTSTMSNDPISVDKGGDSQTSWRREGYFPSRSS